MELEKFKGKQVNSILTEVGKEPAKFQTNRATSMVTVPRQKISWQKIPSYFFWEMGKHSSNFSREKRELFERCIQIQRVNSVILHKNTP